MDFNRLQENTAAKIFEDSLRELNLPLPRPAMEKILVFFEALRAKNRLFNLISSKQDIKTQVIVHLTDSLTPLLFTAWPAVLSALDIGSGGGLPGWPLALARPDWSWTLAESKNKKASFLNEMRILLAAPNLAVKTESLNPGRNKEGIFHDLITARAVGDLGYLAALAGPRLKPGGRFLAFKGPRGREELRENRQALARQGLKLGRVLELTLPFIGAKRQLLLLEKIYTPGH